MAVPIGPTSLDIPTWLEGVGSILAIAVTAIIAGLDGRARKRAEKQKEREKTATQFRFMNLIGEALSIDARFDSWRDEAVGWFTPESWYVEQIGPELLRLGQQQFCHKINFNYVARLERIANLQVEHWPNPSLYMEFYGAFVFVRYAANSLSDYVSDNYLDTLTSNKYDNPEALRAFNFQLHVFNHFEYLKHCVKEFERLATREGFSSKYFYTDGATESYVEEDRVRASEINKELEEILNSGA